MDSLDALVIAPHPDDAELGMAGAILSMQAKGLAVGVLDLTTGEPTPHGTPKIRAAETAAFTSRLVAWLTLAKARPVAGFLVAKSLFGLVKPPPINCPKRPS